MINKKLKELIYNDEDRIIKQRREIHQNTRTCYGRDKN